MPAEPVRALHAELLIERKYLTFHPSKLEIAAERNDQIFLSHMLETCCNTPELRNYISQMA
jgi:hypothetical protein